MRKKVGSVVEYFGRKGTGKMLVKRWITEYSWKIFLRLETLIYKKDQKNH